MKRRFKYILSSLLVAAMVLVGFRAEAYAQQVDEVETIVNIHKIETDAAAADMSIEELTLGIDDLVTEFGEGAVGLPGVTFQVYSVTQAEYEAMYAAPGSFGTAAQVVAGGGDLVATTAATDANGLAQVTLGEGYFWVIEVPQDTIASSRAVPFGLTLPYTNADGDAHLEEIHVYPKNTLEDTPTPPVKTVEADTQYIGQNFDWTVTTTVPNGIAEYTVYQFVDTLDTQLDFVSAELVNPTDLVLDTDYTLVYDATTRALTLDFTAAGIAKLVEGEVVELDITTVINNTVVLGRDIENNVTVNFTNPHTEGSETGETPPEITTGGRRFIKTIDTATGAGLAGARFVLMNAAGEYIVQDATTLAVTFSDLLAEATVFESAADGTFDVRGLAFGTYTLVEIEAPDGYALPTNPNTSFTVDATSYYVDPTVVDLVEADPLAIVNKAITIPQTGGPGTILFTIAGAGLMIFAVIYYKRSSKEQEVE